MTGYSTSPYIIIHNVKKFRTIPPGFCDSDPIVGADFSAPAKTGQTDKSFARWSTLYAIYYRRYADSHPVSSFFMLNQ